MNLFFDILGYEFKKTLCKRRTVVTLIVVILVSLLSVFGTLIGNVYYNDGETVVSKYDDFIMIKQNKEKLSGRIIDADLIMEAVDTYKDIFAEDDSLIRTPEYQYSIRKYDEIYSIVRRTFGLNSAEEFCALTREQAEQFGTVLKARMNSAAENSGLSESMSAYWKKCFGEVPETLTYEYCGGYGRFIAIMYTTAIMAGAAIAIIVAGIFSEEYTSGAASLILSSKHGRGLVIAAKLTAAFVIAAVLIIFLTAASYAETMIVWGSGGADGVLIMLGNVFPYNMTVGESVLLYSVSMLAACLLFAAITALFSAVFKTPFSTIIVMAVLLIAPMFISVPDGSPVWVYTLENLLPTNMMAFWGAMYEYQYEIFGVIIPPYVFLPIFAVIVSCVCVFFASRAFKKHQVS